MTITEATTVADIAASVPSSVGVFQAHGIDFCCGGKRAIGDVCRDQGVEFSVLADAITASTAKADAGARDWTHEPLHALIEHIISTYHDRLREDLPVLEGLAARAREAHGRKAPDLVRVADALAELSADLVDHMQKEELVLFPIIRALEEGDTRHAQWISAPVTVMEREHEHAGALLDQLRQLTNGYTEPEWACATVKALYRGVEALERSMHVHVHLENNVLFPRALSTGA